MSDADEQDQRQALTIIRVALLMGVVLFGALAWVVARVLEPGGVAPTAIHGIEGVVWYGLVAALLLIFGAVVAIRSYWQAADSFEEKRGLNVAGWAVSESAALIGGLYLLFVGDPTFFGAGLALMGLATFVLLPIPEAA